MKPGELINVAIRLLQTTTVDDPATVERAAALLGRQAIEECASKILAKYGLEATLADFTSQLICLQAVIAEKAVAKETAAIWGTLSAVVHHEALELGPTESELVELIARATKVVQALEARID